MIGTRDPALNLHYTRDVRASFFEIIQCNKLNSIVRQRTNATLEMKIS